MTAAGARRVKGGRGRPPAITDVAAVAGVSYQTVSRVINEQPGVRPSTRDRVVAAMKELNYQPNSLARSLVSGRSLTIGVISTSSDLFGPNRTFHAVQDAVREAGYSTLLASVQSLDRQGVEEASRQLRAQAVDGIVMTGSPHPEAQESARELHKDVPLVVIGRADPSIPTVDNDPRGGARKAVRHLLALGHKTVWHIGGPTDWMSARRRADGWRAELAAHGAVAPDPLMGDWSAAAGYDAGQTLARNRAVSAVFAANDHIALGALRAFSEEGRCVPGDISLVGFDDIPEAEYLVPPLTTVRQDFTVWARLAVSVLISEVRGEVVDAPHRRRTPKLIVRSSTAAPSRVARSA